MQIIRRKGKSTTLIVLCLMILASGCESFVTKENSAISVPSKVIIYYRGKSKELDAKGRYFSDVIRFTEARFKEGTLSVMKNDIDSETIDFIKKRALPRLSLYMIRNRESISLILRSGITGFSLAWRTVHFWIMYPEMTKMMYSSAGPR